MRQFGLARRRRPTTGAASRSRPNQRRAPADVTLPPDIGSARLRPRRRPRCTRPTCCFRGLSASIGGARADHPEAALPRHRHRDGPADGAGPRGRRRPGPARRGAGCAGSSRLPPDARHAAGARAWASSPRAQTSCDNVAHVRLKESDRVVGDAAAQPDGRRVEVRGDGWWYAASRALARRRPVLLQRPPRPAWRSPSPASRARGREPADLPERLPDLLSPLPRRHERRSASTWRSRTTASARGGRARGARRRGRLGQRASSRSRRPGGRGADRRLGTPLGAGAAGRGSRCRRRDAGDRAPASGPGPGSELDREADRPRQLLLELGVAPGETVAYQLPNWGEFVVAGAGAARGRRGLLPADADLPRAGGRLHRCAARGRGCWSSPTSSAAASTPRDRGDAGQTDGPLRSSTCSSSALTGRPPAENCGARWHDFAAAVARVRSPTGP